MQLRASWRRSAPCALLLALASHALEIQVAPSSLLDTEHQLETEHQSGEASTETFPSIFSVHRHIDPWANIVEALVEMESEDASFGVMQQTGPPMFAQKIAARVSTVLDLPIARLVIIVPDITQDPFANIPEDERKSLACQPTTCEFKSGAFVARWASEENTTFVCQPFKHALNETMYPPLKGPYSDFTHPRPLRPPVRLFLERSSETEQEGTARIPIKWEVGIVPPTDLEGDVESALLVAHRLVDAFQGSPNPKPVLLPNGTWEMEAGESGRYLALFPNTRTSLLLAPKPSPMQTSLAIGPKPEQPEPPTGDLPGEPEPGPGVKKPVVERPPASAAEILTRARQINAQTNATLEALMVGMYKASATQYSILNDTQYGLHYFDNQARLWPFPVNG